MTAASPAEDFVKECLEFAEDAQPKQVGRLTEEETYKERINVCFARIRSQIVNAPRVYHPDVLDRMMEEFNKALEHADVKDTLTDTTPIVF